MREKLDSQPELERRRILRVLTAGGLASTLGGFTPGAWSNETLEMPFENGRRDIVSNFPQKSKMILLRTRPPLLETPFSVFDRGVFTPNSQFYVRWHLPNIPTAIDGTKFRLAVRGQVNQVLSLSLKDLITKFERIDLAAVNQCSGNSRGWFAPRVAGGQWNNGAMGNAMWTGVRLKDVLARAGLKGDALQVRFNGMDTGVLPGTPDFLKSLDVAHANDGEVMLAYAMNGEALPLINGFPLRLIVPGWYSTYWVKMLNDIEVLNKPDDNYWMTKAYLIPDTPGGNIGVGQTGVKMVPINKMVPRSFFTNVSDVTTLKVGKSQSIRGIAFGGDAGIKQVLVSLDDGKTFAPAKLGTDHGKYSFRQWQTTFVPPEAGKFVLKVKAINSNGLAQPDAPIWNPGGFMRNVVESVTLAAA
ncbi:hypothetical protein LMG28138_05125 [Pararobbsia alpina]|uniref:Protein-methionine-sulfoxide reductase catalytic subunit MsrP n=2 Tax=Pararobbsia alpina TaxID=621374 RepID=A0A6S7C5V7_9BURK|nr:hypothetical protein LMG28138_05125 [Pararobbsia alpina]